MQNAQQILVYSTIVITLITLLAGLKVGVASYAATLGDQKFKYRLDKTKLPMFVLVITTLAILLFGYGLVIARDVGLAAEFCLATTFFGGIGLILRICYVRK